MTTLRSTDPAAAAGALAGDASYGALERVRAEYLEMPGLTLTLTQAARLCAIDAVTCGAVLATLVDCGFLVRRRNAFARP